MKKFIPLVLLLSAALASCGTPAILADAENDYYASGHHAGWGDATQTLDTDNVTKKFIMEAVSIADERVKSIKAQFESPEFLYVKQIVLGTEFVSYGADTPNYSITEGAQPQLYGGNLTVKVIQTDKDAFVPNYWAQAKESGKVNNLTPNTLYIPPFFEDEVWENSGTWGSNPVALVGGTYILVFGSQVFEGDELAELFMGLIPVQVAA